MMKTIAWQSLSCVARALYVEIASRYGGPGSNNGKLHYSIRAAAKALGVSKTTAAKAFADLQDRGFIEAMMVGGFNVKNRRATEWRLTAHASDISTQIATKDFERWHPPGEKIQNTVPPTGRTVPLDGQHGPSKRTMAA